MADITMQSTVADVEEIIDVTHEEAEKKQDEVATTDDATAKSVHRSNINRAEKKARKALLKMGLVPVPGIGSIIMSTAKAGNLKIDSPEVFKSEECGTFIIFGEAKMDDRLSGQDNFDMDKLASSLPTDLDIAEPTETKQDDGEAKPAIETNEEDVTMVMQQAGCSREVAISALTKCGNDVIDAILAASEM